MLWLVYGPLYRHKLFFIHLTFLRLPILLTIRETISSSSIINILWNISSWFMSSVIFLKINRIIIIWVRNRSIHICIIILFTNYIKLISVGHISFGLLLSLFIFTIFIHWMHLSRKSQIKLWLNWVLSNLIIISDWLNL